MSDVEPAANGVRYTETGPNGERRPGYVFQWFAEPARPSNTGDAIRHRRYRAREKSGRLVVSLELGAEDLEILIEARTLDPRSDCHTREAIAAAVRHYLQLSRHA